MKQHLVVKLANDLVVPDVPHWQSIISNKSIAPDRFIPSIDRLLSTYGLSMWVTHEFRPAEDLWAQNEVNFGLHRVYRLVAREEDPLPAKLVTAIRALPEVEYADSGKVAHVALPSPTSASLSLTTDVDSRNAIFLSEAHRWNQGDELITVAILDTGVCLTHPEILGRIVPGYDFVDILDGAENFLGDAVGADPYVEDAVGHGTHVAGIISGRGLNMPAGVAPRCRILPVKVLAALKQGNQRVGAGLVDNINAGLKWAVDKGAHVINMSFGLKHDGGGLPHREIVEYALSRGVTLVAASGNDGSEALYYPGALPGVIAVGASAADGQKAFYSTFGPQVTLVAPGTDVFSSYREDGYAFATGTSQAAPFVSGTVALLKSMAWQRTGKHLPDHQVKQILKHTADRPDNRFRTDHTGYGQINVVDALRLLNHRLN